MGIKRFCRICHAVWFFPLIFFGFVWLPAFAWFYQQIPIEGEKVTYPVRTDAIVVLTGGQGRFDKGLKLLMDGTAGELLVSGVSRDVKPLELVEMYGIDTHDPALANGFTQIALDHAPNNTVGNAESTAAWMQQRGYHSLRLVTSSYHMPRSLMEFHRAMPEVIIIPEPAFPEWGTLDKVFLVSRGSLRLILWEFHKYMARRLYYLLPEPMQVLGDVGGMEMPSITMMTLGSPSTPTPQPVIP